MACFSSHESFRKAGTSGKFKNAMSDRSRLYEGRGFNSILGLTGLGIVLFGLGHILFAIFVWLKDGVWKTISLGYWFNLGKFDTGFIGLNKILNFIVLDISATLPLVALGFFIYAASRDY